MKKTELSFTLIELLIVIAIIAIVAGAVLVAINPAKRIAEAQDSQRWSEVRSFSTAIGTYAVDNRGQVPKCDGVNPYNLPADGIWRWIGSSGSGGADYTTDPNARAAWLMEGNFSESVFVNNTSLGSFVFNTDLLTGSSYKLFIGFNNDSNDPGPPPVDRNLYVDKVTITPAASLPTNNPIEAENTGGGDFTWHDNGAVEGSVWNLWANGDMGRGPVNFPSNDDYSIDISARGSLVSDIGPHMTLMVTRGIEDSVNSHNGTESGVCRYPLGINEDSINFDGTNYVDVPYYAALDIANNLTIMAWVKTDELVNNTNSIITKQFGTGSGDSYMLGVHNDTRSGFFWTDCGTEDFSNEIVPGVWYHFAGVAEGTNRKFYLNGQLTKENTCAFDGLRTDVNPIGIGAAQNGSDAFFGERLEGSVDEIAIFNRVLSANEIKEIAIYGLTGQREYCNLTADLLPYLASQPADPANSDISPGNSAYMVKRDPSGIITIKAPFASEYADQEIIVSQ